MTELETLREQRDFWRLQAGAVAQLYHDVVSRLERATLSASSDGAKPPIASAVIKPPAQGVNVPGMDVSVVQGAGASPDAEAASALAICAHPYFQDYVVCKGGDDPSTIPDSVAYAADYLLRVSGAGHPNDLIRDRAVNSALKREIGEFVKWKTNKYGQDDD